MKPLLFIISLLLSFHLSSQNKGIKVYVVIAEDCPICNYMGRTLSDVAETYKDKVEFYAVFPVKRSNYKTINAFKKKYNLEAFESILDSDQLIVRKYNATVTPEVIIADASDNILYRGRVNDAYTAPGKRKMKHPSRELERNILSALNGNPINEPWPEAIGCFITFNKHANQR